MISPGTTSRRAASKLRCDCSSFQVRTPLVSQVVDEIVHGDPVGQPRPLFTPVNLRKAFSRDLDWSGIRRQRIHLKSCTVFQHGDHRHGTKLLSRVSDQMMHADSPYSSRKAINGSIRDARRAGK